MYSMESGAGRTEALSWEALGDEKIDDAGSPALDKGWDRPEGTFSLLASVGVPPLLEPRFCSCVKLYLLDLDGRDLRIVAYHSIGVLIRVELPQPLDGCFAGVILPSHALPHALQVARDVP